jgi:hypothetical protein
VHEQPVAAPSVGRSAALYTGLRALLFVGSFGVLLVAGADGLPAIFFALVVSSLLSVVLLRGPRDQLGRALAARAERKRAEGERLRGLLDDPPAG